MGLVNAGTSFTAMSLLKPIIVWKSRSCSMNIYTWGCGSHDCLGLGVESPELTQLACGCYHTAALTKSGEVFTWGQNNFCQLGHGDINSREVPTKVAALAVLVITKISCGVHHTAALTDKGGLLTWGCGWYGQLGHGFRISNLAPKKVEALADVMIVEVACGGHHTCVVTSTGSIFTWGYGIATGHGGDNNVLRPRLLQDLSSKGVISVSAYYHSACVTKAGEVFTWGHGCYGRLGHGDKSDQLTPKRVEALVGVKAKQVSCGSHHTAVCTEEGHMYTIGRGKEGQLGHGDKENKASPSLVQALEGKHITQVQCGETHTMALTSSGYVFTLGDAKDGALGHGKQSTPCCPIPCLVEGLREHNVVQISCGSGNCAVLVDPTSPSGIRQSQQDSFNNKEYSDVVFMVENEPVYANVDVLCQRSHYFAAMFRSNMKENIERVVQVPKCSKAAFLLVLEYLCLDGFTVSIHAVVELWSLADFYQLEGLKLSCLGTLERGLCEENVSQILEEAEDLSCPCDELKSRCHEYLERIEHRRSKRIAACEELTEFS